MQERIVGDLWRECYRSPTGAETLAGTDRLRGTNQHPIVRAPRGSCRDRAWLARSLDARGDVTAALCAFEADQVRGCIRAFASYLDVVAYGGAIQHSAARGDQPRL